MTFEKSITWILGCIAAGTLAGCSTFQPTDADLNPPLSQHEQDKVCRQLAHAEFAATDTSLGGQPNPDAIGSPQAATLTVLDSETLPAADPTFQSVLKDWEHLTFFPFKTPTRYTVQQCDLASGDRFLAVDAKASASSMVRIINKATNDQSRVRWKWWVSKSNKKAQTRERALEDSPIRVVLAFDGDKSRLSEEDQGFLQRMEVITRRPAPYATLMYSIGAGVEKFDVITPQYTKTIRIKAVQTSTDKTGLWRVFDRNIENDFLKAFGEKPGRLMSIAIMGDADNTKSTSRAYIADLELLGLKD